MGFSRTPSHHLDLVCPCGSRIAHAASVLCGASRLIAVQCWALRVPHIWMTHHASMIKDQCSISYQAEARSAFVRVKRLAMPRCLAMPTPTLRKCATIPLRECAMYVTCTVSVKSKTKLRPTYDRDLILFLNVKDIKSKKGADTRFGLWYIYMNTAQS